MSKTSDSGPVATSTEQALVAQLAAQDPDERSWEAIARMRRLSKLLDGIVRRETPRAIVESRAAEVTTEQLVNAWDVTSTWIYRLVPARARKSK